MSYHGSGRYTCFERITDFILKEVKRGGSFNLTELHCKLCKGFGANYFCKKYRMDRLMDSMEYLLYTGRLVLVEPAEDSPKSVSKHRRTCAMYNNPRTASTTTFSLMMKSLVSRYEKLFRSNLRCVLAQYACQKHDPLEVSISRERLQNGAYHHYFSHKIKDIGLPVTNQRNSGRCWIFACLNAIRIPFMKQYKIKEFEFSQSHIFFWDKIERSNHFLNAIVLTAKRGDSLDSRLVMSLLNDPVEDGGHWNMVANIITKHGLMPQSNFPESFNSKKSEELNDILNSKLRGFASILRTMVSNKANDDDIQTQINQNICTVYRIVGICLGIPSEKFAWSFYDCHHKPHMFGPMTSLQFYEELVRPVFDIEDKVCLISDPRTANAFGKLYTVEFLNNTVGGAQVLFNNQPIEVLLQACQDSIIERGEAVWFGCQIKQRFSRKLGLADLEIHDFNVTFDTEISNSMSKAERITYQESSATHAMIFIGINLEGEKITKFCVENSWGRQKISNGYLMMTVEWFKEYVFELVVDKTLLPESVLQVYKQEPIMLKHWDPLGKLLKIVN